MASSIVKMYITNEARLSQLPLASGQLIFVKDTGKVFLDFNGARIQYHDIQVLATESARIEILAPITGFYFVEETNILFRYKDGEWHQITPSELEPLFFGNFEDFPEIGKEKILYIADDSIYKWFNGQYRLVSNSTVWSSME